MGKKQRAFEYELMHGRIAPEYARLHLYDGDDIDSKISHILYEYLSGNSDSLPSYELIEKAMSTKREKLLSQGYGIELTTDMTIVSYKKVKKGLTRIDIITDDSYIAYFTNGRYRLSLDLEQCPVFDIDRVRVVQIYLRRLKKLYIPEKIDKVL